ncbi:MAG TPA: thioredoxin domain-containing protein [Candidatus Woesebacteria bacterium]|nr:thioredoxin domain-containing protein [Candidatus Woesebacteria bacterium]HNS65067.1 thioredoxin domain-containing protein [Candidatus Woesebacteria bacterium]
MSSQSSTSPLGSQNTLGMVVVALVLFVAGFFLGQLWQENKMLKSGIPTAAAPAVQDGAAEAPSGPTKETLGLMPKVTKDDHILGASNPKVTLVEYSDFECPFCNRFHPTVKQIIEKYGDEVALVYRHFPLSFHPFAQKSAEASECVAKQKGSEGFWKYADYIFGEQTKGTAMSDDLILKSAQEAGVNVTAFQTCLDSGEMKEKVTENQTTGGAAGISGTPGTIIVTQDGPQELIPGALPFESVEPMIQKYL